MQIVCFLRRACGAQAAFHKGRGARRARGVTEGHDLPGATRRKGRARGGGLTRRRAAAAPGPRDRSPGTACRARPAGRGLPEGERVTELAARARGGGLTRRRAAAAPGPRDRSPGTACRARPAGRGSPEGERVTELAAQARGGGLPRGGAEAAPGPRDRPPGRPPDHPPGRPPEGPPAALTHYEIPDGIEVKKRDDGKRIAPVEGAF